MLTLVVTGVTLLVTGVAPFSRNVDPNPESFAVAMITKKQVKINDRKKNNKTIIAITKEKISKNQSGRIRLRLFSVIFYLKSTVIDCELLSGLSIYFKIFF